MRRYKKDLVELSKFGRSNGEKISEYDDLDSDEGITRVAGSEENKKARDYVVSRMKEADLNVRVDKVGNIFGRKSGSDPNKDVLMSGSHIDSVKNGGMFDGALGVVSALEAVRRLDDEGFGNERSIEIVVLTGEEGSAFPTGLLGSSVLINNITVEQAYKLRNEEEKTLEETLKNIGYKGNFEMDLNNVKYFIETHIEQGPILEKKETPIGIVDKITGISWIKAKIIGEEDHAGTTPMDMRKDPLIPASEAIKFINDKAKRITRRENSKLVATVGEVNVTPNSPNIIPKEVELGIDIRDIEEKYMNKMIKETKQKIMDLETKYNVETELEVLFTHEGSNLSQEISNAVRRSGKDLGIKTMRMNSGAGHDAQNIAEKVKTGLIFLPSVDGVSHAPKEWTNWEDIEKGVQILTKTFKKLTKKTEN